MNATRVLGFVLLVAAGLKLYGLAVDPVSPMGFFSSPWVQVGLVELEILLGVWFVVGSHPRSAWVAATALFTVFAGVSLFQGWVGQASCGCLGTLDVSPWYAFALDVLALLFLAVARPKPMFVRGEETAGGGKRVVISWLATAAAVMTLLVALMYLLFDSPDAAIAFFKHERLSVRPQLVDVGTGAIGESRQVEVELVNRTAEPIRVFGGTSDCSCVTTQDLPVKVEPGETRAISVMLRFSGQPGIFTRTAELYTQDAEFRKVRLRLTGRSLRIEREAVAADEKTN